jgi:pre-mRNA-splicing factor CDC5/CEF1
MRTPRAPPTEDHIANEIRNIRALTETQSSLLGGENNPLHEGSGTTGFDGIAPRKQVMATPNPLATPARRAGPGGVGATPLQTPGGPPGATPLRTPRDNFAINEDGSSAASSIGDTPREIRLREAALKQQVQRGFASLPKPKATDFELELPDEQAEPLPEQSLTEEDAAVRDHRNRLLREAAERAEFKRRTQVLQRGLPRPSVVDTEALLKKAAAIWDPNQAAVEKEMALLIANDGLRYPIAGAKKAGGTLHPLEVFDDDALERARMEIILELPPDEVTRAAKEFSQTWDDLHPTNLLPGLAGYAEDEIDEHQLLVETFGVRLLFQCQRSLKLTM